MSVALTTTLPFTVATASPIPNVFFIAVILERVNACEKSDPALELLLGKDADSTGLSESFDCDDARNDRVFREVSSEEIFVICEILISDGIFAGHEILNPVDEKEGMSVRNDLHDACCVE